MKILKNHTELKKLSKQDSCYYNTSKNKRIAFVWELTKELWSFTNPENVKRRLQRNITRLIRIKR